MRNSFMINTLTPGLLIFIFLLQFFGASSQPIKTITISSEKGLAIAAFDQQHKPSGLMPLVSFMIGETPYTSLNAIETDGKSIIPGVVELSFKTIDYAHGAKVEIKFTNLSQDTVWLHNVVPLGESPNHVYITGKGKHGLSRTHLFRPGFEPVNVIVPDNAWELGFSAVELPGGKKVCALTRRDRESIENGKRRRFETELNPKGSVKYTFWADFYSGEWQEGLRLLFQNRKLYDVEP